MFCCFALSNGKVINSKDRYTHDPSSNSHTALETDATNSLYSTECRWLLWITQPPERRSRPPGPVSCDQQLLQ